ncbi:MAG: hypothetical protein OEW08_14220 [Gammaproteobacteria bacterium]|nr:hypothetical protein [Gammaproteobacteria bacterium]
MTMASKKTLAGMLMWVVWSSVAWAEAPALNPDHDYAFEWRESGYTFTDLNDNKVIAQGKSGARYRQNTVMVWTGAHDEACRNNKVII